METHENAIEVQLSFGTQHADANFAAVDLRDFLVRRVGSQVSIRVGSADPNHMDVASVLWIVLSAPALVEVARGIADWMRRARTTVVIGSDGTTVVSNVDSADAVEVVKAALSAQVAKATRAK